MGVMVDCIETQLDRVMLYFYQLYLVFLEDLTKNPDFNFFRGWYVELEFDANYACIYSVKLCMYCKQYNL